MASFNTNGLRNENKRREVFNYLRTLNIDIILLQETHSSPEVEKVWISEWGGPIFFTHGSTGSRGATILVGRNIPITVETSRSDSEGRYLILDLLIESKKFILVNVYAPNEDEPIFLANFSRP